MLVAVVVTRTLIPTTRVRATTSTLSSLIVLLTVAMTVPGPGFSPPKDYFRSPLGIPILLSGNFAEMRDNHFHGGLDMKTRDSEGYRIYAAADGYISRVKVSPYGYGNALYVAHPNGYTTVYAHVSRFKGRIAGYVRRLQDSRKTFAIDKYLEEDRFPVKEGDVIALSGNSGSSSGPHLHFEIRKTSGQIPVNPLLFGLEVPDSRAPSIYQIRLYPRSENSGVRVTTKSGVQIASGRLEAVSVDVKASGDLLQVDALSIEAWGDVGFGVQTHDYHDGSGNRLGVYTISLHQDGETIFESTMDEVSFGNTRYINAHVDYAERKSTRRWIQRSFVLPGNELPIYRARRGGIVSIEPGKSSTFQYDIVDAHGNRAQLSFDVAGTTRPQFGHHGASKGTYFDDVEIAGTNGNSNEANLATNGNPKASDVALVKFSEPFVLSRPGVKATFPAKAFYEDVDFAYTVKPGPEGLFSPIHVLHETTVPVHRRYSLSIAGDRLPPALAEKAVIVSINDKGELSSAGGAFEAGQVTARLRSLGSYAIAVDSLAPTIRSLDLQSGDRLGKRGMIRFVIDDDLSGISKYNGYLNGKWVLFAYDAKRKRIYHEIDPRLASGEHILAIEVEDRKGNASRLELSFRK